MKQSLLVLSFLVVCLLAVSTLCHSLSHQLDGVNLLNRPELIQSNTDSIFVYVKVKDEVLLSDSVISRLSSTMFGASGKEANLKVTAKFPKSFTSWLTPEQIASASRLSSIIKSIERVPFTDRITFSDLDMDSLQYSNLRVVFKEQGKSVKRNVMSSILNVQQLYNNELTNTLSQLKTNKRNQDWLKREFETAFSIAVEEENEEENAYIVALQNFNINIWPLMKHERENQMTIQSSARDHISNMLTRRRSLQEYTEHNKESDYTQISKALGSSLLKSLTSQENIESVARQFPQELLTFGTQQVLQNGGKVSANKNKFIWDNGVTGTNQVVQVIDSGAEVNHCYFFKAGENVFATTPNYNNRKIIFYQAVTLWGDKLDNNGHGSHCNSIVAGSLEEGSTAEAMKNDVGVAPNAKLYVTDVMRSIFFYVASLNSYLTTAYGRQVRVSSNSWGCANPYTCSYDCVCYEYDTDRLLNDTDCLFQYGVRCCEVCNSYDNNAATTDSFTRANDEMLVVFAAGNNGYFSNGGTILTPATSKNALSVGAQYAHLEEYTRFNTTPVDEVLFNNENMSYFSARGNTHDGRSKPDVVAPGVLIWAAYHKNVTQCTPEVTLTQKSGTSMAAPAVAGSAALVRDYLSQNNRLASLSLFDKSTTQTISGPLVKAMIIHSAQRMTGFVPLDATDVYTIPQRTQPLADLPFPNKYNGFGSVNLKNALLFEGNSESTSSIGKLFLINRHSLAPGDSLSIPFYITNKKSQLPIKITLTWYDYAGTITNNETATLKQLINDVDVTLVASNEKTFNANPGVPRETPDDRINTVERINVLPSTLLSDASTKDRRQFSIKVDTKSSNIGNQTFSLVISGDIEFGTAPSVLNGYKIVSKGSILAQNAANLNVPGSIASNKNFAAQKLVPSGELNLANDEAQFVINTAIAKYQELSQKTCDFNNLDQNVPYSGMTITSGVHCFPQGLNGNAGKITFSGSGPFILNLSTNLNANYLQYEFTNGASPDNVYWIVGYGVSVNGNLYGNLLTNGVINMNVVNVYGFIYNLGGNTMNLNQVNFH